LHGARRGRVGPRVPGDTNFATTDVHH
jgi:hypothetical protein